MKHSFAYLVVSIALLAGTDAMHAQSKQMYTWTDENGVVHFVDTPPADGKAVSMNVPEAYRPGTTASEGEAEAASDEATAEVATEAAAEEEPLSYADQKRQEMAAKAEERRAKKMEADAACNRARQQVDSLEPSRRVYFTNEQGEEERVDDEVRVKRVEDLKDFIAKNCQ